MSATAAISGVLPFAGVAVALLAVAGAARDGQRLRPPSLPGARDPCPLLIAAAIWVREGPSIIALQATLLAGFLLLAAPAPAHGTARAARISEHGDWRARRGEAVDREGR